MEHAEIRTSHGIPRNVPVMSKLFYDLIDHHYARLEFFVHLPDNEILILWGKERVHGRKCVLVDELDDILRIDFLIGLDLNRHNAQLTKRPGSELER